MRSIVFLAALLSLAGCGGSSGGSSQPTLFMSVARDVRGLPDHGTVSPGLGDHQEAAGSVVPLTATPDLGYGVQWTGTDDDSSTSTANTITMPSYHAIKQVTVTFYPVSNG